MASFFLFFSRSLNEESPGDLRDSREEYGDASPWDFVDINSGCCIVSDARIDYRQELVGKLGLDGDMAKNLSESKLILFAYLKWGEAFLSHLYGDFSFVIWDPGKDEILCARDHFGCRPLYYLDQEGFLAVASKISAFTSLPDFSFEIREQYILDAVCAIERAGSESAYKGISRLKPAHYLKQSSGQLSTQYQYWNLKARENYGGLTLDEAADGLRKRIIDAVGQRCRASGPIGVELSGGLDSSGIASVLAGPLGQQARLIAFTHSASSGVEKKMTLKSEAEYCKALLEKYASIKHFYITEEDSAGSYKALCDALYTLYKPVNLHYALNSDLLFEAAARSGTSSILSGLGGDEGITYSGYGYWNELIHQGQHSRLRDNIKNLVAPQNKSFRRRLLSLYVNYYIPWVLNPFKKDWRRATYRSFAPQKDLARKYRMRRRYYAAKSLPDRADVKTMQYFRLNYPIIPERMEETYLLAQLHGIEYSYPFLDVKLLEFFYSLPSAYKYRDGTGRHLFRQAMKDVLPEKIRMRKDKGGNTIPNVFARLLKDEETFRKIIEEGRQQNQFHYVDYDKLHRMLDSFKTTGERQEQEYGLKAFQSAMSVVILQAWQREGKVDIGIIF